jgi:hypothetical protein
VEKNTLRNNLKNNYKRAAVELWRAQVPSALSGIS